MTNSGEVSTVGVLTSSKNRRKKKEQTEEGLREAIPYHPRSDRHHRERRAVAASWAETRPRSRATRGPPSLLTHLQPHVQASKQASKQTTTTTVPTTTPQTLSRVKMFHAKRLQKELSKVSYPFSLSNVVEKKLT